MKINALIYMSTLLLSLCLSLFLSTGVQAHEGHDHLAPEAALIHLLWIIPGIIAMAVLAGKIYLKALSKTYNINQVKIKKY